MDFKQQLISSLSQAVLDLVPKGTALPEIFLERPKIASHGDFACNVAMPLAKLLKENPRALATKILEKIPTLPFVEKQEVAGAGFINITLQTSAKRSVITDVLLQGATFGRGRLPKPCKVQVEFVSANPTGPLHVGHGRGAAFGASLSDLLDFAGFSVSREYYVNDAGRQMDILALSAWLRYLALCEELVPFPPNGYQGDYVREMAKQIKAKRGGALKRSFTEILEGIPLLPSPDRGDKEADMMREAYLDALIARAKMLLKEEWFYVHHYVLAEQLTDCRSDLEEFGVVYETWFSEKSLFDTGLVERCIARLHSSGHVYEQNGALWFRSTAFGDEKDRVVKRDNGIYTYFASDIAYHLNKFERGFDEVINVWGADHHGYISRVKGALSALCLDPNRLFVPLVQFAVLWREGQKVQMSTRSGKFVTLRELREEVGNDACRFFYTLRKADQHLDFDLDLAKKETKDNPVYYIQYAHARICSVFAAWGGKVQDDLDIARADLSPLIHPRELKLAAKLAEFPDLIATAAREYAPHHLAFYLKDLASEFHAYYDEEKVLVEDEKLKEARLLLLAATKQVIQNALTILGVSSPIHMKKKD